MPQSQPQLKPQFQKDSLEGKKLPEVSLDGTHGKTLNLPSDLKGKWALFYFYPKDDTPGCTKQACGYRDNYRTFEKEGILVFGVSLDSVESHLKFQKKYDLTFPLLSDPEHKLSDALGVYGDKEFAGKKYKGLNRDSFLVDPKGVIRKVWRKVRPEETIDETLKGYLELKKS